MNYKRKKPKKKSRCGLCANNRIGKSGRAKNVEDTWRAVFAKYP